MNFLIIISLVVGVLAALWTVSAISLGFLTFAGFMAWSTFFASGGKKEGLKTTLVTNLSGVLWGIIILELSKLFVPLGLLPSWGLAVFIGAAAMCLQSKISLFAYIPGTFIGCATFFGANFDIQGTIIGLIIGAVLGYISEAIYTMLGNESDTQQENSVENV